MISHQTTTAAAVTAAANRATGAAAKLLVFRFCFNAYFMSSVITLEPVTAAYYIKEQTVLQGEMRTGRLSGGGCRCVCARARFNLCQWPCIREITFSAYFFVRRAAAAAPMPLVNTSLTNMAPANERTTHTHTCCL